MTSTKPKLCQHDFYQAKTLFFIPLKLGANILALVNCIWNIALIAVWSYLVNKHSKTTNHNDALHIAYDLLYFSFNRPAYITRDNIKRFHDF